MKSGIVPGWEIKIFIAGDAAIARQICRQWCFEVGACVTVTPTNYIYTGGEESGVIVGIINYARFPTPVEDGRANAHVLAERLRVGLCQHSYSILTPDQSEWVSHRKDAA